MEPQREAGEEAATAALPEIFTNLVLQPPPATTFDRFADLPAELRIKIWREALAEASKVPRARRAFDPAKSKSTIRALMPAVLQVCHETRSNLMALQKETEKERSNAFKYHLVRRHEDDEGGIYFNWAINTLRLDTDWRIPQFELQQFKHLRSLAVDYEWGKSGWLSTSLIDSTLFLDNFPKLESLTIVVTFSERKELAKLLNYFAGKGRRVQEPSKYLELEENHKMRTLAETMTRRFDWQKRTWGWKPPTLKVIPASTEGW